MTSAFLNIKTRLAGLVLLLVISFLSSADSLSDKPLPPLSTTIHEKLFKNGFKVLVLVDNRSPVVVSQMWYRIGGSYEYEGITGISHFLEHLMFKGTLKYPSGQFERIMARNGAENNAFTSQDYTVYYEVLASNRLAIALEIEADRMNNLILTEKEFQKELEVVKEERRLRTDDNPNAMLREQFNAQAFMQSPYRSPVIGWMSDIETMTLAKVKRWYQQWYAPNNATLVVVGDVNSEDVFALSERYFASLKAVPLIKLNTPHEIPQQGQRNIVVKAPAKLPALRMGYKVPSIATAKHAWEPYALEVLATILEGGRSSRFSKVLVREKELVAGAYAAYYGFGRLSDLFVMGATPNEGVSIEQVKNAILAEIKQLQTTLITSKELERVKAQVIAEEIYERDSIENIATIIGSLDATGLGYQLMDRYVPEIKKITPEQIRQVAQHYFLMDRLTVAELIPKTEALGHHIITKNQ